MSHHEFYVAVSGTPEGDGSKARPWNIVTALAHPASVRPGDTIWVRGGTYGTTGREIFRSRLLGKVDAPIIVRSSPGERAIINGWLQVGCCDRDPHPEQGAYVWFWGLEFASSITDRTGKPAGPPGWGESAVLDSADTFAPGSKFINNVIHDTRMGISMWMEAIDAEAYGNIIYHNGFQSTDRGHGHGFYVQNKTGTMKVTDNVIFNQFDNGIQAYGSDRAFVRNMVFEGNIVFNNGSLAAGRQGNRSSNIVVAGGDGAQQIQIRNNYFFHTPELNLGYNQLGWGSDNGDLVVENNAFVGGFQAVAMGGWKSATFQRNQVYSRDKYEVMMSTHNTSGFTWNSNTYYGSGLFEINGSGSFSDGWPRKSGLDTQSSFHVGVPKGTWVLLRPNRYEQGRANIAVVNWDLANTVSVSLEGVISKGQKFQIRDVENLFAPPLVRGSYDGSPVRIPMTGSTVETPRGSIPNPPKHSSPLFGAFLVLPD